MAQLSGVRSGLREVMLGKVKVKSWSCGALYGTGKVGYRLIKLSYVMVMYGMLR